SDDGVTTSFQRSRNSRPPMLDHQDKCMMKAQDQTTALQSHSSGVEIQEPRARSSR
nr:hypothetical protein [Tanacetum cinerariifolium]